MELGRVRVLHLSLHQVFVLPILAPLPTVENDVEGFLAMTTDIPTAAFAEQCGASFRPHIPLRNRNEVCLSAFSNFFVFPILVHLGRDGINEGFDKADSADVM